MSYDSKHPHVRFLLERPAEVPLTSFNDDPPPWEPRFEDISSFAALPLRRRPLDPPPPCFSIPSPIRIKSHDFPTFRLPAVSDRLTDGFCALYPYKILEGHGIDRADWARFLEDLGIAARLSNEGLSAIRSPAPCAPLLPHRIFPSRALGAVYDGHFSRSPVEEVRALIQIWNQCAFERRKIRVTLHIRPIGMARKSYMLVVESL